MIHRAGLIGDVHGQLSALRAALNFLKSQPDLDVLLCTGDLPERGTADLSATAECCQLLSANAVTMFRGNHDRWHVEMAREADLIRVGLTAPWPEEALTFLSSLPSTWEFDTPLGPAMLCHGLGRDDMNGLYRETDGHDRTRHSIGMVKLTLFENTYPHKLVIAGHTHQRMVARFGEITIINAGALEVKTDPPTVGVVDFDRREVRFFDIDPETGDVTEAEVHRL